MEEKEVVLLLQIQETPVLRTMEVQFQMVISQGKLVLLYHLFLLIKNNSITSVNECCASTETLKDSSKETVETQDEKLEFVNKGQ